MSLQEVQQYIADRNTGEKPGSIDADHEPLIVFDGSTAPQPRQCISKKELALKLPLTMLLFVLALYLSECSNTGAVAWVPQEPSLGEVENQATQVHLEPDSMGIR